MDMRDCLLENSCEGEDAQARLDSDSGYVPSPERTRVGPTAKDAVRETTSMPRKASRGESSELVKRDDGERWGCVTIRRSDASCALEADILAMLDTLDLRPRTAPDWDET